MGHYRDGINIKLALKHLKTQPHRLNETGDSVDKMMETIKDIPPNRFQHSYLSDSRNNDQVRKYGLVS